MNVDRWLTCLLLAQGEAINERLRGANVEGAGRVYDDVVLGSCLGKCGGVIEAREKDSIDAMVT